MPHTAIVPALFLYRIARIIAKGYGIEPSVHQGLDQDIADIFCLCRCRTDFQSPPAGEDTAPLLNPSSKANDRTRTCNPLITNQLFYQLNYVGMTFVSGLSPVLALWTLYLSALFFAFMRRLTGVLRITSFTNTSSE